MVRNIIMNRILLLTALAGNIVLHISKNDVLNVVKTNFPT